MSFDRLETERSNPDTWNIDRLSTHDLLAVMQREDAKVAGAIKEALPEITVAVDAIVQALRAGGRLYYVGAGTSGRLGVLDAAECPPTFGTSPDLVQALIAGGRGAVFQAVEGAEDDYAQGMADLRSRGLADGDVVVGLAASGRTPYVVGALRHAVSRGCCTVAVVCTKEAEMKKIAQITISVPVGPEVITGSTRLKAGTAQKMVLNMLSTAVMVKLGKTYGNLMVDVRATNAKLTARVRRIVREVAKVDESAADEAVHQANGSAKVAIVMLLGRLPVEEAKLRLRAAKGSVHRALEQTGAVQ